MKLRQFLDFLKCSLDPTKEIVLDAAEMDWEGLYRISRMQSILGVVFEGVQRMVEAGDKPPRPMLLKWIAAINAIKEKNQVVNNAAVELSEKLRQDGFESCILKGQGNNLLYPNVYGRVSGDIDVWIRPLHSEAQNVERYQNRIIRYAKGQKPDTYVCYHHLSFNSIDGIEVELHYRPSFMFHPIHNRRLQEWYRVHADQQFQHEVDLPDGVGKVAIPDEEFNLIFQLTHIYNHLLHEGIGLRQVIDYYYLLKSGAHHLSDVERVELRKTLHRLGLEKIAETMMWVLSEGLGLGDEYLIAPKDERRGRVLLYEIMRGGNFGHYDKRNIQANSPLKKNIQRLKRDFRMMRYFPSECLWEPVFRLYHFFWRLKNG